MLQTNPWCGYRHIYSDEIFFLLENPEEKCSTMNAKAGFVLQIAYELLLAWETCQQDDTEESLPGWEKN